MGSFLSTVRIGPRKLPQRAERTRALTLSEVTLLGVDTCTGADLEPSESAGFSRNRQPQPRPR